ncbi:MAG: hypothetical protein F6J98_48630 [Moorea sp. SIO4G2]|nr:hypothetical protein [Moorena sp. SIO4G2]
MSKKYVCPKPGQQIKGVSHKTLFNCTQKRKFRKSKALDSTTGGKKLFAILGRVMSADVKRLVVGQ